MTLNAKTKLDIVMQHLVEVEKLGAENFNSSKSYNNPYIKGETAYDAFERGYFQALKKASPNLFPFTTHSNKACKSFFQGFSTLELLLVLALIASISAFTLNVSLEAEQAINDYHILNQSHYEQYQQYLKQKEGQ